MPSVTLLKPAAITAINAQIADIYEQLAAFTEFDPDLYSTTTQINDLLTSYVPKTRTIASGNGVKINGGASATLSGTITVSLDFASNAEAIAGVVTNKPLSPSGLKAAIAELSLPGMKGARVLTASGTYTRPAGVAVGLILSVGAGGSGGSGYTSVTPYSGGSGGDGGMAIGFVTLPETVSFVVGAGGASVTGPGLNGNSGGNTEFAGIIGTGGGGGKATDGSSNGANGINGHGVGNILSFGADGRWQFFSPDYGRGGAGTTSASSPSGVGVDGFIVVMEF